MHISDGILPFEHAALWYAVAALFIAAGVREIKRRTKEDPAYMPKLAIMGAAIFVISVWHFPVPVTGSSSHPVGTPMAAILIGGFPAVVLSAIALVFQLFLAHGGLTTLGANAVSMGIVGAFSGLLAYKALRKLGASMTPAAGFAGFAGDMLVYATTSAELALGLAEEGSAFALWKIFMLGFAPTQVPLAALEFAFTAGVIKYLAEKKPKMFITNEKKISNMTKKVVALWLIVIVVVLAGAYFGSRTGDLGGTDAAVEEMAAKLGSKEPSNPVALSEFGENVAFTLAGLLAGIFTGYFLTAIEVKARKEAA